MPDVDADWLHRLIDEVEARTGIVVRDRDRATFAERLAERVHVCGRQSLQDYGDWLLGEPSELQQRSTARGQEWQQIVQRISVTESYFFRDRGQFTLLREHILPQRIRERRRDAKNAGQRPRLRLWSAACSTGEEPYSLAIVLQELLTDMADWDIQVIATDINEAALAIARTATYSDWSFRLVEPPLRDRHFQRGIQRSRTVWQLDPSIAQRVHFAPLNLAQSSYHDAQVDLSDLDLILCRNVFIYLSPATIGGILQRMALSLNPAGYLLTAHAELQHQNIGAFKAQLCPQSVVYQRRDSPAPLLAGATAVPMPSAIVADRPPECSPKRSPERPSESSPKHPPVPLPRLSIPATPPAQTPIAASSGLTPNPTPNPTPRPTLSDRATLNPSQGWFEEAMQQAIALFHRQDYPAAITLLERLLQHRNHHLAAHNLLARAYANLGQYHQAAYYCSQALVIDPCATLPYYLMAQLAENSGDTARAKTFLKRIIYLDPEAALAYLELAALYRSEGDRLRAERMKRTARILLAARRADETLDPYRQISVGFVLEQIGEPGHPSPVMTD